MKYLNWLKIQKCYPYPLIFESVKKIMDFCKKKKLRKTIRPTGLKSESIMPIIILHNWFVVVVWYHKYFFQFFFTINFYPFLHFWPSLPCTSQWGKFLSSKFCISDFRIEIYTKFQSGKHIFFLLYSIFWPTFFFSTFFFHTKCLRNPGQILNPVICMLKWAHPSLTITFIMFMFSTIYMQAIG